MYLEVVLILYSILCFRNLTILNDAMVHPLDTTSSKAQIAQNRQGQNQLIGMSSNIHRSYIYIYIYISDTM
jgi:hypothetical protein